MIVVPSIYPAVQDVACSCQTTLSTAVLLARRTIVLSNRFSGPVHRTAGLDLSRDNRRFSPALSEGTQYGTDPVGSFSPGS